MALRVRAAPRGSTALLSRALDELKDILDPSERSGDRKMAGALTRSGRSVPIYNLVVSQLLPPYRTISEVAGKAAGWRYLLRKREQYWYADFRAGQAGLTLNQLVGGPQATRFATACRFAKVETSTDAELRVLRIPSARFQALWLASDADEFIDLAFVGSPVLSGPKLLQTALR